MESRRRSSLTRIFDDIGLEDLDFDDAGFTVADSEELDGLGLDE